MIDHDGQKLQRLIRRRRRQHAWANRWRQTLYRILHLLLAIGELFA
jgi:hypothetical protein